MLLAARRGAPVGHARPAGAAPATINKVLAAVLRGTVREAWRLGLVDAETLARVADVEGAKARRLPAGRHVEDGEVRQLFAACGSASRPTRRRSPSAPCRSSRAPAFP